MKTKFIEQEIKYTGLELAPHWIYRNFNLQGNAMVAFVGECDVKLTEMVDIEDVINNEPIYSKSMLSFILEHFNIGLIEGVIRQRLLICTIKETIEQLTAHCSRLTRKGDDLFIDGKKLSVSIATKSLTSVLIHVGINIDPSGAPVDAIGLNFLKNLDIKEFAQNVMVKYSQEIDDIILASTKVVGR
ncbi:MAG: DUF366 family protein [Candidatus Gastranaerophilales bacterium]|nr:DUF366 family protein [Candidatus Gastranaerophilales bacterium]